MMDIVELNERPESEEMYLLVGWRQWADAGSVSSGLPQYLVQQMGARKIGGLRSDSFYLFQFPGTHDLVRPVVRFEEGYPQSLSTPRNELFYTGDQQRGLLIFLGDEPHMEVERYVSALIEIARAFNVKRVVTLGGVYGELPYDKERMVSCIYSLPYLKEEVQALAVNLSDYNGGASIGSYLCRRAGEQGLESVGFYSFVPLYDFSTVSRSGNTIRIENDFMAWLGVMRRISHMLKLEVDLSDLEHKSDRLVENMDEKVEEIDTAIPNFDVREHLQKLSDEFVETPFNPLDEVWEDEIRRLLDKFDDQGDEPPES